MAAGARSDPGRCTADSRGSANLTLGCHYQFIIVSTLGLAVLAARYSQGRIWSRL